MNALKPPSPVVDEDLQCLKCDYNLTGLTSDRCPECGAAIDWSAAREARDAEVRRPGTRWERWPWYLKPAGFAVTAFQAALMPWVLARQLRERAGIVHAMVFLLLCLVVFSRPFINTADREELCAAVSGILTQIILQVAVFWALVPIGRGGRSWRFWLAVSAYTSYPLLLEGILKIPPPIILLNESNVLPLPKGFFGFNWVASVLFYLWWFDLAVVAFVRGTKGKRWRVVPVILAIPGLVLISTHTAVLLWQEVFSA
ncbi:MAG TPA: hypothetical protein VLM89_02485 [Phycisphaerae bacterium]|nr:hypothetical protein [Phycisphaerae bacterium]